MKFHLPASAPFNIPQSFAIDKLATLIGENGAGKSSLLQQIFQQNLALASNKTDPEAERGEQSSGPAYKVVCFSSGQNENYSGMFGDYLNKERGRNQALKLDCFFYDKSWSKLLIFLATVAKKQGRVREFLRRNDYVETTEPYNEDVSTSLNVNVKVDQAYINRVNMARDDEILGAMDTLLSGAYHRTLDSFMASCVSADYEFEQPLPSRRIALNSQAIAEVSFEEEPSQIYDPMVTFFTMAADNNYFIQRDSLGLNFKNGIELDDLSDGEYQLLFLYALIDLLDSENTLFLLDEADSHLHFENLASFWDTLKAIKGNAITTTHLLDSIANSGIENIKVVTKGEVQASHQSQELARRFKALSDVADTSLKVYSLYQNIVLMDDYSDWEIFKLLVLQKLGSSEAKREAILAKLRLFVPVKKESNCNKQNTAIGKAKIDWAMRFKQFAVGQAIKTKQILMICDRDDLQFDSIGTPQSPLIANGVAGLDELNKGARFTSRVFVWRRREMKHYLLCYSALGEDLDKINNPRKLVMPAQLHKGCNADYLLDDEGDGLFTPLEEKTSGKKDQQVCTLVPEYNDPLALQKSKHIKSVITKHIDGPTGFDLEKTRQYVAKIPPEEISEDIAEMYRLLTLENPGKNGQST